MLFVRCVVAIENTVGIGNWHQGYLMCSIPSFLFIQQEIWARRFEYWYRKLETIPGTIDAAKVQACQVKAALADPWAITYKQIATGLVWAVQVAGCFCIGEMIARRDIRGYDKAVGVTQEAHH